ncbi:alpha/beta-hydrolase [Penicillium odoratum]|uniref:alpha/beta-hydrolase n=1 Tax=Penicillium odoratum TaxID=1167516 RepID=UPI002548522E|nr:alpha/beta-hydrolase [Penicillium odoratum]KAJ5765951.1 alpha/beta-hydrolase [Penicillium odoratum]
MTGKVQFSSRGVTVAAHLYLPPPSAPDRKGAGVVCGHPMGGVKEQTSGTHAKRLADQGFVALAFDAAYQGESGGEPRGLEDPFQRAEDVRAAVTFLATAVPEVDPNRIGAFGICASGGYVCFASQTDLRIKAIATLGAVDTGEIFRDGMKGTAMQISRESLRKTLQAAGEARMAEARGECAPLIPLVPDDPTNVPEGTPDLFRDASDYYQTPRAGHPRANNRFALRSYDLLVNYSSFAFMELISPRPLLMMAGSEADTKYFSEEAIARALDPKELYVIPEKAHIATYDDLTGHFPKLVDFMAQHLCW